MIVTVHEVQDFLRCRHKWDYGSVNRQSLVKVGMPDSKLLIGTLVHWGIAERITNNGDWRGGFDAEVARHAEEYRARYRSVVGDSASPSIDEISALDVTAREARDILLLYETRWPFPDHPLHMQYLPGCVEVSFKVPLEALCPALADTWIAGTFDGLLRDPRDNRVWIIDHKTYKDTPADRGELTTNFQFLVYMWALSKLIGAGAVGGVIYDGISKSLPKPPGILQSGKVSRAKVRTTWQLYMDVLTQVNEDPADYAKELFEARWCENHAYHARFEIPFTESMIDALERDLHTIVRDMPGGPMVSTYRNLRWEGCWDCGFKSLCHAELFGEDVEWVRREYVKGTGYGTTRALELTPDLIHGVEDLASVVRL